MKKEEVLLKLLNDLKQDDRLKAPPADVLVSPELALIQLTLITKINTLESVLELPLTYYPTSTPRYWQVSYYKKNVPGLQIKTGFPSKRKAWEWLEPQLDDMNSTSINPQT